MPIVLEEPNCVSKTITCLNHHNILSKKTCKNIETVNLKFLVKGTSRSKIYSINLLKQDQDSYSLGSENNTMSRVKPTKYYTEQWFISNGQKFKGPINEGT